ALAKSRLPRGSKEVFAFAGRGGAIGHRRHVAEGGGTEAVAVSGEVADGPLATGLAQNREQGADGRLQRVLRHGHAWPERLEKLAFRDHAVPVTDQVSKEIEDA